MKFRFNILPLFTISLEPNQRPEKMLPVWTFLDYSVSSTGGKDKTETLLGHPFLNSKRRNVNSP